MNLSKEQLLQIVREETLAEIGVRDALMGLGKAAVSGGKKLYRKGKEAVSIPTHTGGRVTRGGSQGQRAQDASVLGVDASETPAEAAGALAAETPYGPEHSIHTATRSARGEGRVTAGGSGGERAKAAERLGVDPSQDPVDVDPWTFPGGPGEVRPYSYADLPGKPQRGHRGRGEPNEYGDVEIGEADYDYLDYGAPAKESLTRSRLRQAVMEEIVSMTELGDRRAGDPGPGGPPVMRGEMRPRGDRRSWQHVAISSPASLKVGKSVASGDRRASEAEAVSDAAKRAPDLSSGDRRASEAEAWSDWSGPPERGYAPRRQESLTRSRLRQAVMEELSDLRGEKILDEKKKKDKDWIQKAVDPEHEGYCTPMTKKTCTPPRKALAKRFKKAARKEKKKGGTGWEGKV